MRHAIYNMDNYFDNLMTERNKKKDILRNQDWYYKTDKEFKSIPYYRDSGWHDIMEDGHPCKEYFRNCCPDFTDRLGNPEFLIVVRYFEYDGVNELKSCVDLDRGWYDLECKCWLIENDWDETGCGIEVLAWKRHDQVPERYVHDVYTIKNDQERGHIHVDLAN